MRRPLLVGCIFAIFLLISGGAYAEEGEVQIVWVSATDLIYAGSGTESSFENIFHLSYKYSSDWVLLAAKSATFSGEGITYTDGIQYSFNTEGKKLSESQFSGMLELMDYAAMEKASLGDDGTLLTPFTGASISYAVIQSQAGTLHQISLARDAEEYQGNLHLYDGFMYQFGDDLKLKSQIAFSEISFSTQGLLRSNVVTPPPAAPLTTAPPTTGSTMPPIAPYVENPLPAATGPSLIPGSGGSVLIIPDDYDVPPIETIGVVMFTDHTGRPDFIKPATEAMAARLSKIDGIEVKTMPYDKEVWGGGILFERAVELGKEYSVDAFIISDITDFDLPSEGQIEPTVTEVRVSYEMDFAIVDCVGGRIFWRTAIENNEFISVTDIGRHEETIVMSVLRNTIDEAVGKLIGDEVLAGGPIGKDW